jgi:predicted protein tyrosine phosphatase
MPAIHVCALSRIETTAHAIGARSMVSLINAQTPVPRPACVPAENHLFIGLSDITEPRDGHILPGEDHVRDLLAFARAWDRAAPLLIHCYAGVSRSTAAAYIAACALRPELDERALARLLRERSPTATPNIRLVETADRLLRRGGRMAMAIAEIGRGADCFEGAPFSLSMEGAP